MARGPHPAREDQFLLHWNSIFGLNVARNTRIKAQCGLQKKIVAHPCSKKLSVLLAFGGLFDDLIFNLKTDKGKVWPLNSIRINGFKLSIPAKKNPIPKSSFFLHKKSLERVRTWPTRMAVCLFVLTDFCKYWVSNEARLTLDKRNVFFRVNFEIIYI